MANTIDLFNAAVDSVKTDYLERRQQLSFAEYLSVFAAAPRAQSRDAAAYLLDVFDHFGSETVSRPWGKVVRYKLFDQEFAGEPVRLVGQEAAQGAVRAAVAGLVREGRVNHMVLIHGPNGSAKSTLLGCLMRGLEHYSRRKEGALYRFRWIFPARQTSQGVIGFGARLRRDHLQSFAHLEDDQIDATLECDMRDHPLLILPKDERRRLIEAALDEAGEGAFQVPEHLLHGSLCHRCRQVADALIRTHQGDLAKVLAHVQVERWAISRRYRRGVVHVGPQMSIDAGEQQITADRSLAALPTELQNVTLFETMGPLVDGSGGVVVFEDMLKRPLDAFKYLLGTIETGEALLAHSILRLNTVLLGSTNDEMLEAFREHHDYLAFRDRLTLVPVPYIREHGTEARIYELQIVPHMQRHVAPHAVRAAAHWAVLTRLHRPDPSVYPEPVRPHVAALTAAAKADLYEDGTVPDDLSDEEAARLREIIADLRTEDAATWSYEGRYGASPRLIRQVILDAAIEETYPCLTPFAVLGELEKLCGKVREHPFLERATEEGGYHDHRAFVGYVEERILDAVEEDLRAASGLVEESRYLSLLEKYIANVRVMLKGESQRNPSTGQYEGPDTALMEKVEDKLGAGGDREEFRNTVLSRIAGFAIENPGRKMDPAAIFPGYLRTLKDDYFSENTKKVVRLGRLALALLSEEPVAMTPEDRKAADGVIARLVDERGYCRECARAALGQLFSNRHQGERP
ncbi:MAG: serine protein kinase PrkA [Deltaproteobacteria bacterium]|nr:serine protein kinase PrkA [Deltaproteobacteria bacterium]